MILTNELSCFKRRETSKKVICDKSNFQTVIFALMFVTLNGHIYKLIKNTFNDVQSKDKGEINIRLLHNYSKYCILILYQLKG